MAAKALPLAAQRLIHRRLAEGRSHRQIGREVGCDASTVGDYAKRTPPAEDAADEPDARFQERADGTATAVVATDRPIRTLADAVRAAEVDESVWYVERWECGAWTVGMKMGKAGEERTVQSQQYRVKVFLRRLLSRSMQAATEAVFERLARHAPKYPPVPKAGRHPGEPTLAVLGLFDVHFGKLCWGRETGTSYDLAIAEAVYANAVDDLVAESAGRPVARWVLPIGNDFFHIDNPRNTTFSGTPVDTDGRYAKVIEAGEMAVVAAVERLMLTAPVQVVWVPGNHDPTTSYHLARTVQAWFRRCDRVTVDAGPSPRKYVAWEGTLLGLTHGNEERPADLPALMATEQPAAWGRATCREWLLGHQHRSRQWRTQDIDTHQGTVTRVLRSLAGTDSWHHKKGFTGAAPAAEVYWYGKSRGYAGHAVVPARGND